MFVAHSLLLTSFTDYPIKDKPYLQAKFDYREEFVKLQHNRALNDFNTELRHRGISNHQGLSQIEYEKRLKQLKKERTEDVQEMVNVMRNFVEEIAEKYPPISKFEEVQ